MSNRSMSVLTTLDAGCFDNAHKVPAKVPALRSFMLIGRAMKASRLCQGLQCSTCLDPSRARKARVNMLHIFTSFNLIYSGRGDVPHIGARVGQ
jgi:hypothetical protein